MLLALIIALVTWASPGPTIWECPPGHSPGHGGLECEQLHYHVLSWFRL